jgi:hypothetical protein
MAWPPTPAEVRAELRVDAERAPDADVSDFIARALAKMERTIGPRRGQAFVSVIRLWDADTELPLNHRAGSVESVTVGGVAVSFEFDADSDPWMVYTPSVVGPGRVVIEATAPNGVPDDVRGALVGLAAHFWLQARPGLAGGTTTAASPMGYAVPNRIASVFAPHREVRV